MSNCLSANYLAANMANLSPRGEELVNFLVSIVFADGHYIIAASRDDCGGVLECYVDNCDCRAVLRVVRAICGYGSSYWGCAKYCEVSRNLMAQLRPYLLGH